MKALTTEYGRLCTKCLRFLSWDSFYRSKLGANGKMSICKTCMDRSNHAYVDRIKSNTSVTPITEKKCSKCGRVLPVSCFYRLVTRLDGLEGSCKECRRERERLAYPRRRLKISIRSRQWKQGNAAYKKWCKEYAASRRKTHPWLHKLAKSKRRARIKGGYVPEWAWAAILWLNGHKCVKCDSTDEIQVDHIIPLARGGRHHVANLQPLCRKCNIKKHAREWDGRKVKCTSLHDLYNLAIDAGFIWEGKLCGLSSRGNKLAEGAGQ